MVTTSRILGPDGQPIRIGELREPQTAHLTSLHHEVGNHPSRGLTPSRLAQILGPSFAQDEMADVIDKLIKVYVEHRTEEESFLDTFRRVGIDPFKERVYAANH